MYQHADLTPAEPFCSASGFALDIHGYIANYAKTEQFKTSNICYFTVSGNQVRGNCLADSSGISAAGATSLEALTGTGKPTSRRARSHDHWWEVSLPLWFLAGGLHFLLCGFSTDPLECPHVIAAGFPRSE